MTRCGEVDEAEYEAMPNEVTDRLFAVDQEQVGGYGYAGIAYFWHHTYRFELRPATFAQRREVHAALLDAGLPLDGFSEAHDEIIRSVGIAVEVDEDERASYPPA